MGQILTIILFTSKIRIAIGIILAVAHLVSLNMFWVPGEYSFFQLLGAYVLVGICIFIFIAMLNPNSRYRSGQALWWEWLRAVTLMSVFGWLIILGFIYTEHAEKKRRRKCAGLHAID